MKKHKKASQWKKTIQRSNEKDENIAMFLRFVKVADLQSATTLKSSNIPLTSV